MPVNTYTMGPGELTLGATQECQSQVRACELRVTENVTTTEAVPVLSGEELPAESDATFSYVLVTDFQGDLGAADSVIDYSWANAGELTPFVFTPNTVVGRSVTGSLWMVPLNIGGTAKAKPNTEVTWRVEGTPALGDIAP